MAGNAERTYLMIKPDGVQRGLAGKIIMRFEERGYKLVSAGSDTAPQGASTCPAWRRSAPPAGTRASSSPPPPPLAHLAAPLTARSRRRPQPAAPR